MTTLVPGAGWGGATAQPDDVGSSPTPGYDANAIARWNVVPDQTFAGTFDVGVVAFHYNGIERVDFSVDDGDWVSVYGKTLNRRTGVWEYWVTLDASLFAGDQQVEVRAIAYPATAGVPRVLGGDFDDDTALNGEHSLFLYANAGGTYDSPGTIYVAKTGSDSNDGTIGSPKLTLKNALQTVGDGGVIEITEAGRYMIDTRADQNFPLWTTIRPSSSLDPWSVEIGPDTWGLVYVHCNRVRFQNIAFDHAYAKQIDCQAPASLWTSPKVWFHDCWFHNSNGWEDVPAGYLPPYKGWDGDRWAYCTDCSFYDMVYGPTSSTMVRNATLERISGDMFQNSLLVLNCTASDCGGANIAHHTDVFQYYTPGYPTANPNATNVVVFGVRVKNLQNGQTFFWRLSITTEFKDVAFVNVLSELTSGVSWFAQNYSINTNVLFKHVTLLGQAFLFRITDAISGQEYDPTNVLFDGCVFKQISVTESPEPMPAGAVFDQCHFFAGTALGTNSSSGSDVATLFDGPIDGYYYPKTGSALLGRVSVADVECDLKGFQRPSSAASGALESRRYALSLI